MKTDNPYKVYVEVTVSFKPDGTMFPRAIYWIDGIRYDVDRIVSMRPGFAAKAGGQGDMYTIKVNGRQTKIFFERATSITDDVVGKWFVESRAPILN